MHGRDRARRAVGRRRDPILDAAAALGQARARLAPGLRVHPGALLDDAADKERPSLSREQAFAAKIANLIEGASSRDLARFEAVARAYFGRAQSGVTGKAARDPGP